MRLDVGHAPLGERPHQLRVTDHGFGVFFGAPTGRQEPVIGLDDFGGHEPVEQALDAAGHERLPLPPAVTPGTAATPATSAQISDSS